MTHGYEFTPAGIVPIDATPATASDKMHGAAVPSAELDEDDDKERVPTAKAPSAISPRTPPKSVPLKPRDVIKLARARLREVNREISRIKKLEKERDELSRLVAAADGKPIATVRALPLKRGA